MNLFFYVLLAATLSIITLAARKKWFTFFICGVGIACVVNAIFFTADSHPIDIFGLDFGIGSILYTVFVYTIVLMYIKCGRDDARNFVLTGIFSITLAIVFDVIASLLSGNFDQTQLITKVVMLVIAVFATASTSIFGLFVVKKLKDKNVSVYWQIIIGVIVTSTLYFICFFFANPFVYITGQALLRCYRFLSAFISEIITLGCCTGAYFISTLIDKREMRKLKEKEEKEIHE